ncbi:unnamed protein product [Lymnaea stagnalis]|uniref:Uncharacterized protein n=1 Tax=Lymnaea stagnalis TaxID=6523 RepID=A0AAV2H9B8_LYMST
MGNEGKIIITPVWFLCSANNISDTRDLTTPISTNDYVPKCFRVIFMTDNNEGGQFTTKGPLRPRISHLCPLIQSVHVNSKSLLQAKSFNMLKLVVLALLVLAVSAQDLAAQKAHVMCVIDSQLSSASCKRTAKAQVNAAADAASGCATLETFHGLLGIIGCNAHDYDILHKLICEHIVIPCDHATTVAPA